ncbi:MAG: 1-deoxy-D-xylulose-5-phosphate reductoisomerase [Gemmatimonadaceae bacterium]|nr:1-deoxy-D-xylulose-5-phosphate reductoisomerase [Gemmatimonadaceae bacterium]
MRPQGVALLGATGSIGASTLAVIGRHPERFVLRAITAHSSAPALASLAARWAPAFVGLVSTAPTASAQAEWTRGPEALIAAATRADVDVVVNAVVGAAGLDATLAALRAGKRVALANKESLVVGGALVLEAARAGGGTIIPVDSEHSAILQCLHPRGAAAVRRLIITASGGPFRQWESARIATATREDALKHPTWSMGAKITVDSASLANKALEVIEAHHLFGVPYDRIEVVVHPQSVVHSMVEFHDGSVVAQLGVPSMELPVLYALSHPERLADAGVPRYDPVASGALTFEAVRRREFPMLDLGISAGRRGGAAPAVFNAANEAAVAAFLTGRCAFGRIAEVVGAALDRLGDAPHATRDALMAADAAARTFVEEQL